MKRFLSAVAFCTALFVFGSFFLLAPTRAEKNTLEMLLKLPAPPPPNPLMEGVAVNRPEEFFSKSKPPADDASEEDLLAYWEKQSENYRVLDYNIKPSEQALRRILAAVEKDPESITKYLNVLPDNSETANFVKGIYERGASDDDEDADGWRAEVRKWLTYHSDQFSDDLLKSAQKVRDADEYVTNQEELLALARVDWEKARPILDRLLNDSNQPVSQTLARWAFYRHALDENDSADIENYRSQLKKTVEDKTALDGNRDLAMDALVKEKEWNERDDWYMTLLGDETLADLRVNGQSYTGLTTVMYYAPPEKYAAKMIELLKSDNPNVRGAAVRNLSKLLDDKNPEVVRALLPWLDDAKWAKETSGERRALIAALAALQISESVPGLIHLLDEKTVRQARSSANMNSNMSVYAANTSLRTSDAEGYLYRDEAIAALAMQKDIRAAPALRLVLPQVEEWQRGNVVRALIASHGFSVAEEVAAIETVAKNLNQEEQRAAAMMAANKTMSNVASVMTNIRAGAVMADGDLRTVTVNSSGGGTRYLRPLESADINLILGTQLANDAEPDEELINALVDRITVLDTKDPQMAAALRKIIRNWRGAAVNALLLRDLKNDKSDVDSILKLLTVRKELREKQSNEVNDIRSGSQIALGISACLLEQNSDYEAILDGDGADAKIAMLACARLIRARLNVPKVAANLRAANKLLARAAQLYLESEDSPSARAAVLAQTPNEAKILGAMSVFSTGADDNTSDFLFPLFMSLDNGAAGYDFYDSYEDLKANEDRLRQEVKENQELRGVYSYDKNFVRIYKDKAVYSFEEDAARYRERDLTPQEFDALKNFLIAQRADEQPPFLSACEDCEAKELVMVGRGGGRRVFLKAARTPKFFKDLDEIFADIRRTPGKLHYYLEKTVPGLEILYADDNLQAVTIWKNGADFRVLINNAAREKQIEKELEQIAETGSENEDENVDYRKIEAAQRARREQLAYGNYGWFKFDKNVPGGAVAPPELNNFIPARDGLTPPPTDAQWKMRAGAVEVRADDENLYKIVGGRLVKLREGYYRKPLVTPNGRWTIVSKYGDESALVRINLLTGKEFKIKTESYPLFETVAFVPSINKVLVFGGSYRDDEESEVDSERSGAYFLLDAETGILQAAKGEFRPLAQQSFRPLQSTGKPDEFWAAIPNAEKSATEIGVYNAKTFSFKSLLKVPRIGFNSMDMWADEKDGKIYFAYEGHLLSLPLPAQK